MPDAAPDLSRPLLLAKRPPLPATHFVPSRVTPAEDPLAGHIAAVAAPNAAPVCSVAADAARARLASEWARARTPVDIITTATTVIASVFEFEFSAASVVPPDRPDCLIQIAANGLPDDFRDAIRLLPLSDFADVADLPCNTATPPTYGDFFAPVAVQHGLRAWLVASLADPLTLAVRGAMLFGSADGRRFTATEAAALRALAADVSEKLASRFPLA